MTSRRKRLLLLGAFLGTPLLGFAALVGIQFFNIFHAHEHCIKQAGMAFYSYAGDHHGKFPYDTNGFGNALLLLVQGDLLGDPDTPSSFGAITAPGDKGDLFREALRTGGRIPEEKCSRVYVQGLSNQNDPQIALLFDRRPCPGGDHFRRPWGPLLREVCLLDGSMQVIPEARWPSFASNQVELLVKAGIPRARAKRYYGMAE